MADPTGWGGRFLPEGYSVERTFSEHPSAIVALARSPGGAWVALKLQKLAQQQDPDVLLARKLALQVLTQKPGLMPLRACGLSPGREWLWEELELVDCLDGGRIGDPATYEPFNLRREVIERGPKRIAEAVAIGVSLCAGLETLHGNGWVHRDVKPGNLFRINGQWVLGDYGLTAPPGALFDFKGTEGFMPSEGSASVSADLYGLGKSLYEIWTGCDRLEFPTLPKALLQSPDWANQGVAFNEVLLRACSASLRQRYVSAAELASDLQAVCAGSYRPMSRRLWLRNAIGAAGLTALAGGAWLSVPKAPDVRFELLKAWDHLPENWSHRQPVILDANRGCVFSLTSYGEHGTLWRVDLGNLDFMRSDFEPPSHAASRPVLDPRDGTLLFIDRGLGRVWRLNPDTMRLADLGGHNLPAEFEGRGEGSMPYWNPVTQRLGCFGGHGRFRAYNFRWEFDEARQEWINVEPSDPGRPPWCRKGYNLLPMPGGDRLLLVGGYGNASGNQGQRSPGCKYWDGVFNTLGDLWSLDLNQRAWTCLIPAPGLEMPAGVRALFLPALSTVLAVVNPSGTEPEGDSPRTYAYRMGRDRSFVATHTLSDAHVGAPGWPVVMPGGAAALMFATQGAFRITLEP